jgi:hypothetical protein
VPIGNSSSSPQRPSHRSNFAIERDDGIVAMNVVGDDAPSLQLIERPVRGALMDVRERDDGTMSFSTWADVSRRAVVCSVGSDTFASKEPSLLSVERMKPTR